MYKLGQIMFWGANLVIFILLMLLFMTDIIANNIAYSIFIILLIIQISGSVISKKYKT